MLLLVVWGFLAAYVVYPALQTLSQSCVDQGRFTLAHYQEVFRSSPEAGLKAWSGGLQALWGSLSISLLSVLSAGAVGIVLAFFIEQAAFPSKKLFGSLLLLPMTLPPIVGVVSFDLLFSEAGLIPRLLADWLGRETPPYYLSGRSGVLAIHTYVFFPFFFLLVSSALQQKDVSLGEASRSMGMGALRTFLRIELPMLTPALYGAALMVFMASMASFSAPLLFDIQGPYLSTRIYNLKTQDLWGEAYATTTLFMCSSLGVLVLFRYLRGNQRYQPVGKGLPQRKRVTNDSDRTFLCFYRLKKIAVTGGAMIILLILLLPHLGILLWSLTQDGTWTYQLLPPQYTLDNYAKILGLGSHSTEIWRPVQNSLWMAGTATLANLLFALAAAYVLKGKGVGNKTLTDLLVMLPWALPGTALAINLLATFSHHTPLALGIQLANTVWLLPLAYFIRNIPLVVRPLVAVWEQSGDELEEAARSLGAGRMRTFRTIWIPLGLTALAGGGLMAFVSALGEFISSAILFIPANKPIAMAIYGEFQSGSYGLCSAYGILLILMIAVVMVWGGRSLQRSWGG